MSLRIAFFPFVSLRTFIMLPWTVGGGYEFDPRLPVEATFLSGVFSPLTSTEACEKSSRWLWKEKLC